MSVTKLPAIKPQLVREGEPGPRLTKLYATESNALHAGWLASSLDYMEEAERSMRLGVSGFGHLKAILGAILVPGAPVEQLAKAGLRLVRRHGKALEQDRDELESVVASADDAENGAGL